MPTAMTFKESLEFLDSFLNLERIHFAKKSPRLNLARMRYLLKVFGHPEKAFLPVLIAGTKGKGSSGFFLESILVESGIKTGFYSSPHLETPLERIRIGGKNVSVGLWCRVVSEIREKFRRNPLPPPMGPFTYFEVMTLMAALIFKMAGVRAALFEVGMGGRLDATNVFRAPIVLITPIDLDHEKFLGSTIKKIAQEKAGIIKHGCRVIVSDQHPEAMRPLVQKIREKKASLFPPLDLGHFSVGLHGFFQRRNAGMALRAALLLRDHYRFPVTRQGILFGLGRSNWPGRAELIQRKGLQFLLDGAHNPASAKVLTEHLLAEHPAPKRLLLFSVARDKNYREMLQKFGDYFDRIILTRAKSPRAQDFAPLLTEARHRFKQIYAVGDAREALRLAEKISPKGTLIVITGSFYLLGELRREILKGECRAGI